MKLFPSLPIRVEIALILVQFSGCANRYRLPDGVPSANLRVENRSGSLVVGEVFSSSEDCSGAQSFSTEAEILSGFRIPSGKPFSVLIQRLEGRFSIGALTTIESNQCIFLPTFWPLENANYKAVPTKADRTCELYIVEESSGSAAAAKAARRVATVFRDWSMNNNLSAPACRLLTAHEVAAIKP